MNRYFEQGAARAMALPNRGPLRFEEDGTLYEEILAAYRRYGFYVFEGVVGQKELGDLRRDFEALLDRAPVGPDAGVDRHGRPSVDTEFRRATFQFAPPLSDPMGGTEAAGGRYPVKMAELEPQGDSPEQTILQISGPMELMDSCLRLYGNPHLLKVAEAVNGPDFVPFTDAIWIKEPGLGAAVSWHQDGTTHWALPDLDADTHGFNFMAQLYRTTPENALWIVPESHDEGKIDIRARVEANGSDHLPTAVPLLCEPGDVALCSRQMLHGSFPNASQHRRVTFVFGFHKRRSVAGIEKKDIRDGRLVRYDEQRIRARSRLIPLAVDARAQAFPDEPRYVYQPLADEIDDIQWNEQTRVSLLKDYNLNDLFL